MYIVYTVKHESNLKVHGRAFRLDGIWLTKDFLRFGLAKLISVKDAATFVSVSVSVPGVWCLATLDREPGTLLLTF